jgi:hypothetical protein
MIIKTFANKALILCNRYDSMLFYDQKEANDSDYGYCNDIRHKIKSLISVFNSTEDVYFFEEYLIVPTFYTGFLQNKHLYSNEHIFNEQMDKIRELLKQYKTVLTITMSLFTHKNSHALASIFWIDNDNIINIAIYDPMYYTREDSSYTQAVAHVRKAICWYFIWNKEDQTCNFSEEIDKVEGINNEELPPYKFHNLSSKFCIRKSQNTEWIHCVQYIMNA